MVFNEKEMPLKSTMEGLKNLVNESHDSKQLEVEFGNDTTRSQQFQVDEMHDEEQHDGTQSRTTEESLDNYQLTCDRQRRMVKPIQRVGYADILTYALIITSDLDNGELESYKEVVSYKEKEKWFGAMKEEMKSLLKNKT